MHVAGKSMQAINLPLYPYQVETKNHMLKGSCINASFCGSGKTLTTLAAIHELGHNTNLIICPKSVLFNWQNEINQWLANLADVFVATGTPLSRTALYEEFTRCARPKFLIMTYDTLRQDFPKLSTTYWDTVVFDEVHYLVNPRSKRFKAAGKLLAKVKYGLTATPIMNSAVDMFGCISAVCGTVLGNYWGFLNRYCVKGGFQDKVIVGFRNMDELASRCAPFIVRKTLEEAQFELPERTDTDLICELSKDEASLYERMRKTLLFELEQQEVNKLSSPIILQNTLTNLLKLQELTDSCELLGDSLKSSKIELLKEHLADTKTMKAVIFTRFSRMAEILKRELAEYNPVVLSGQTEDRQKIIDEFNNNPSVKLFISTEAGGAGINLPAANVLYNYDLPFSLGKMEQRQGRIRWHLQKRAVFFYNLIAQLPNGKRTVDAWVKDKLLKKQELSDRLLISDIKEILV